jgi:hypothetical protein
MTFRFRKSKSIIPGVRINLGKRGVSASVGPKGAKHTIGTSGRRTTLGLPGTGISFTRSHPSKQVGSGTGRGATLVGLFVIILIVWGVTSRFF